MSLTKKIFETTKRSSAEVEDFDTINISISSPDKIRSWSFGEIRKPETINYRTFKPEKDGLFCGKVFGPTKDYECICGKYKGMKYKGIICEKCGTEVTLSKVRRERMAHIELAAPVAHIWFFKSLPSRIGTLLDITLKSLEKVLYFEEYIVIEPGLTDLKQRETITEEKYQELIEKYGEGKFEVGIGAEIIKRLLSELKIEKEIKAVQVNIETTKSDITKLKLLKRLQLLNAFSKSKVKPDWMILEVLPVIPPDLRPLVPLDGGRFATSDLNDLYRRVLNRNNRLRRLIELNAPDIIIKNEKRMLQEAVDALFDNGRRGRAILGSNKRPLKSLSEMLKGKQGRFRQNLLGKRVDYSGRSVIVPGPHLLLHQCGIPKKMALELFKPFIYSKLEQYGLSNTIKTAKKLVEKEKPEVWDILEEVIKEHPVLLNRAPTLHRLGVQAFEPMLIEGKAIQLHPLVCTAFNADFDGDQMAVHVPLSLEAQLEARVLIMSTNNILSPSSGKPIIVPTQDMVLGIYYLSLMFEEDKGAGMAFIDIAEIEHALLAKKITLHSKIKCRCNFMNEDNKEESAIIETTAGRMMIYEILPKHPKIELSLINKILTKKEVSNVIDAIYRHCGQTETVKFCDKIMVLGFEHACRAGISFGKDDLIIPKEKDQLVNEAKKDIKNYDQQYLNGIITKKEKYNKTIDTWSQCTDSVASAMTDEIEKTRNTNKINSVFMMSDSGARGSAAQLKQLAGMRGLMAKPTGEIIETPITSNFKEGLTVLEYFNSTHGARKGLADTALKTANSGYLTRRLVDSSQDVVIVEEDCNTKLHIEVSAVIRNGAVIASLGERILGRTIAEDLYSVEKTSKKKILSKGDVLDEKSIKQIYDANIETVKVRSPLFCETIDGVCQKCYGRDLARGIIVNMGEAVGIQAAQSIGEPGTQLTMRTFHIGGAATQATVQSSIVSNHNAKIKIQNNSTVKNSEGQLIVMSRNCKVLFLDSSTNKEKSYNHIPYGAKLFVDDGKKVKPEDVIASWDPYTIPIISEKNGIVEYEDVLDGFTSRETVDASTGISHRAIIDWKLNPKSKDLKPQIKLVDEKGKIIKTAKNKEAKYFLPIEAVLSVAKGTKITAGTVIARIPRETSKSKDITGGLPRVADLFEARKPKDHGILCATDGVVKWGKDYKAKRAIIVEPTDKKEPEKIYFVPKGKHVNVNEGDLINKGDLIVDGQPTPHDILEVLGNVEFANFMINEIQDVYRLQGVQLNDKHIEVILRQMLKKVTILESGDSTFIPGETVFKDVFNETNKKLEKDKKKQATGKVLLQGITKAALQTKSFISAASFQETTRVLTDAAVNNKTDRLRGLKENVIVGRLIPAGTGSKVRRYKKSAIEKDKEILALIEKKAAKKPKTTQKSTR
ncbi:MAG: DNA-directed RNA polymerase subunit beta' [Alphaproteobacteria bacterium]|nr:DNA-directed RNA polymerase subunit beta' [Alphaproteobacteria bacterium]